VASGNNNKYQKHRGNQTGDGVGRYEIGILLMVKLVKPRYIVSLAALWVAAHGTAQAEPALTLDRLLATVNVTGSPTCAHVELKLNRPVNVLGTDPAEKGLDIAFHIEPLATTLPTETGRSLKEAASVAPQNPAGLGGVVYDPAATQGPVIHFVFSKVMAYHLKRDEDSRHILVDVSTPANSLKCMGLKTSDGEAAVKSDLKKSFDGADAAKPPEQAASSTPGQEAETALSDGKKQLAAGDYNRATAFFTKAQSLGTGRVKQDAQEMLGLSHERAGQLPFAKAEYETYLNLYPTGADASRVKGRLAAVVAAMEDQANKQFALHQAKSGLASNAAGKGDGILPNPGLQTLPSAPGQTVANGTSLMANGLRANIVEPPKDPRAWTWTKNGSLAQYFYRDDNFVPTVLGGPVMGQHKVFQNDALSTADVSVRGENQDYAIEARALAFNQETFGDQAITGNSSLSTVYVDGKLKGPKLDLRAGRQSRSTGGVFGRFDGANLSWEGIQNFKLQVVGGSPVYSNNALPFADNRYFYGSSLEYTSTNKEWGASIYAIEQNVGDIIDRQAIGGEARYAGTKGSVYSAADYDLFFAQLNNAYVTGTWLPRQGTTVYATLDYRKTPFLLTSNALSGQQNIVSLTELKQALGADFLQQCAADRTASLETASAGASQQFGEKWMGSLDASLSNATGTPASLACSIQNPNDFFTPDQGLNFYGSATLSGNSLFRPNDTLTGSVRYTESLSSTGYGLDGSYRIAINDKLRLGPRMQLGLRSSHTVDQIQYLVGTSLNANYRINKNWTLESEIGLRYQDTVTAGVGQEQLDIVAFAGYRYEFQ
jgi:hypothetical protein